jgi:hypothetical protein
MVPALAANACLKRAFTLNAAFKKKEVYHRVTEKVKMFSGAGGG